ncbi:hypothetical protein Psta_4612 [Pirellula staleyi DSM 6068]|uniref:Uncharacterized protein n=1 Tax=Pirellula staleyi (strain ATCC 27377 / DSM 6068 / ICPB 4128) TaxID=530564 RepID=D2R751_PIRSD|nr:hypothetical protein Psta_4612 [Pirellula staleyi DSM 6068]
MTAHLTARTMKFVLAITAVAALLVAAGNVSAATASLNTAKLAGCGCEPAPCVKCVPTKECCDRCITYRSHTLLRCKFKCSPTEKIVLQVTDPCCCCFINVPVCVPCCCAKEAPEVCTHCGILGRTVTEYTWCCGYKVKVIIDRCGDVTVHTYGL